MGLRKCAFYEKKLMLVNENGMLIPEDDEEERS